MTPVRRLLLLIGFAVALVLVDHGAGFTAVSNLTVGLTGGVSVDHAAATSDSDGGTELTSEPPAARRATTAGQLVVAARDSARLSWAGVAANGADDLARLTASQQKSLRSLRRQVEEHRSKLDAYRRDPDAFDNLGYLERAPSPEIRQRIIDGRIRHLENEINTFQDQIDKLLGGG